jgi:hypothetical protein
MGFVVSGFALAILVVGAMGVASPAALMSFVRRWQTSSGIWAGTGFRIAFGVAAWSAAPASRTPVVLQVLGVVSIVSGIALPLLGLSRLAAVVSWWERRSAGFKRGWAGVACAFGAFLLWSVIV